MISIDLEQFVLSGSLPQIDHQTTRADLLELLGPHESSYPDIMGYGHIGFDFPSGAEFLCGVTISFPQYFKNKDRGCHIEAWPDKRFEWKMGRLTEHLTVDVAREMPELSDWHRNDDLWNAYGIGCTMESPETRVTMHFWAEAKSEPRVIDWITAYIRPPRSGAIGRTKP